MAHITLARLIGARRAILTALGAILAALAALGIIPASAETPILTIVGVVAAYVAGDAYIQGKHVEAAAVVAATGTPSADTTTTSVPSTGA